MSLRIRFAAAAGLAVALVVVALAALVYAAARAELRGSIDDALRERARDFTQQSRPGDAGQGPPRGGQGRGRRPDPGRFGGAPGSVQFVAPNGRTSRPQGESAVLPVDARTLAVARAGEGSFYADERVDGTHLRVLTTGFAPGGAVQVARPLTEVDDTLDRLLTVIVILGTIGIGVAALLGGLVARTALAPVRRFTRQTEALIDDPDPTHRLEERGSDELARLARSFNGALEALERSVEAQRQLVADASHELRTPMASLRANIQVLEHGGRLPPDDLAALRADIVAELDELTGLVSDIVELARGRREDDELGDVRLDLVVTALVERFERRRGDAVRFEASVEPTVVRGDGERIARAVSNLIDNACKWTSRGGVVELTLADGMVTVRDHGPGFAAADLPHVFDRFYRSDAARGTPGSGLGLAIVRQAAESHGGSVSAANAPGGGALMAVRFGPRAAV